MAHWAILGKVPEEMWDIGPIYWNITVASFTIVLCASSTLPSIEQVKSKCRKCNQIERQKRKWKQWKLRCFHVSHVCMHIWACTCCVMPGSQRSPESSSCYPASGEQDLCACGFVWEVQTEKSLCMLYFMLWGIIVVEHCQFSKQFLNKTSAGQEVGDRSGWFFFSFQNKLLGNCLPPVHFKKCVEVDIKVQYSCIRLDR